MSISGVSAPTTHAAFEAQRTALILKKQQDVQLDQAQALIQLVKQAATDGTGRLIDVRA
jgi:hypothetical protein